MQSAVIDPVDKLWILDTGREAAPNGAMVPTSYGGPKLIGLNLSNNTIFTTIVPDLYLNGLWFDPNPFPHVFG
jgi:hypothetical protein